MDGKDRQLRHGSLFSGIGGFDLAAEWCGWQNVFHCEVNEFCNKVLNYYWPKAASIKNIIGYEWEKWKGKIDVLSGGFPCQPYSVAGKRLGKADPRHLWPYMLRAIQAIRPTWVVGENVRGIIGWNEGMVFNEVQSDLEAAGYEVIPLLLPASCVGAPHKRERIWFVAHQAQNAGKPIADTNCNQRSKGGRNKERPEKTKRIIGKCHAWFTRTTWKNFPSQSPICNGDDGLSGLLDAITFSKWRTESLKAGGNAIVPHVAFQIFQLINRFTGKVLVR